MLRLPLLMGTGEQSADRVAEAAQLSRFMRTLSWFVTFVVWVAVFGAGADVVRWFRRPRLP